MKRFKGWLGACVVVWSASMGCGESDPLPKERGAYRTICASDASCDGLRCLDGSCTDSCSSDSDCGGGADSWTCGIGVDGSRVCVPPCGSDGYACVDSVSTACEAAGDRATCETCGCPDGERCEPGVGCGPKLEVGQGCLDDQDCTSNNCDASLQVCRVALGAACDASNCERCLQHEAWSFCTRSCSNPGDCSPETACVQEGNLIENYCEPRCGDATDPACPFECVLGFHRTAQPESYCPCPAGEGCSVLTD